MRGKTATDKNPTESTEKTKINKQEMLVALEKERTKTMSQ